MDINYLIALAVALLISGGGLIALYYVVKRLLGQEQGYPNEEEIENALRPFIKAAIQAAYKTSEKILDSFEQVLDGADKKKIADYTYKLLPAKIVINGTEYEIEWIKKFVTKERWEQIIQDSFDAGEQWTDAFSDRLVEEALKLIEEIG